MRRLPPQLHRPLLVFGIVFLAHCPALLGGFLWDDTQYILHNPTLSDARGLLRIWTEPSASPQYYPLSFTTFWIEHRIWGLNPLPYHLLNLALHGLGAALLGLLLSKLGWSWGFAAAVLWGIHPTRVESVAWIAERKDVLSGCFFFATLLAWEEFRGSASRGAYLRALLFFAGALLSKVSVAPLPFMLLAWGWLSDGEAPVKEMRRLAPFLALAGILSLAVVLAERASIDVAQETITLPWGERVLVAGRAWWFYLGKTLWPHPLMAIYPKWEVSRWNAVDWLFPLGATLALLSLFLFRRRVGATPFLALLFTTIMQLPSLGLLPFAYARFSFVADHFQYLPSVGFISLLVGGLWTLSGRLGTPMRARGAVMFIVGIALLPLTLRHSFLFRDGTTLFTDNLAKNPDSWGVHTALGAVALEEKRDARLALDHFRRAAELDPASVQGRYNLAVTYSAVGQTEQAIEQYREALGMAPNYAEAHNNLALLLHQLERDEEALHHLSKAIEAKPGDSRFAANRETILRKMRKR